ncbi:unnamed protein product [Cyclocybe aegerita]|uniref:Uncharacterized protein n=1 Tax=Cyclocybe aegerita TaxID=1973307 RepID=A0A8S0XNY3_CYCAE|nr:unnamed protein product [Cyclocybe aegerita]
MDFDAAWCPACDRQIQPKRYTVLVQPTTTAPPPPPPSSPRKKAAVNKKGGLVNGTGRVRPNGTIKQSPPAAPAPPPKTRTVIDQGPLPLYCSDECQLADLTRRTAAPFDPSREEPVSAAPVKPKKKTAFTTAPSESGSDTSNESKPLSSIERLAQMYNFPPLPPPPPTYEEPVYDYPPEEYNSGIMMAGRLISSLSAPPAKPHVGRYRPAPEPYKVVPGWSDGSNAWRSTVYSFSAPKSAQDPFNRDSTAKSYGSFTAASHRSRPVSQTLSAPSASSAPSHSQSDDMLAKFGQNFARRSESRTSLYAGSAATPSSPSSAHSLPVRRERSIVPPSAEGKLPGSRRKAQGAQRIECIALQRLERDSDDDFDAFDTFATRRPTIETRSWSYDNVKTYPIMQLPPKTIKKVETQLIDGEERQVEVEVEVPQERKRLFLFAPTTRISQ